MLRKVYCRVILLLACSIGLSACEGVTRDPVDPYSSNAQLARSPIAIIDRLLPEKGVSRERLRAVIEATVRVTNINRAELPEQPNAVRLVLQSLTQRELEQIERLVSQV